MKKTLITMFLIYSSAVPACLPAFADEPPASGKTAAGLEKRLSVRFRNIYLPDYLKFISKETGLKFKISDPELESQDLTVFGKDMKAAALIEMLEKAKNLEFRRDAADGAFLVKKAATRVVFPSLSRKDLEDPLLQKVVNKIQIKGVPLAFFLDTVSEQAHINFLIMEEVEDIRITVDLNHTTVIDILQFLKSRGLEFSRVTGTNTFVIRAAETKRKIFSEAEAAFNKKQYERSAAIYKEIAEKNPDSDMADYALLMSAVSYDWLAARDNSLQALELEEAALRQLIKNYHSSMRLGDAYLYLGQIYSGHAGAAVKEIDCKKAIEFYELADKNTYRGWVKAQAAVRKGQCYELAGDKTKALAIYREAVKEYPEQEIVKSIQPRIDGQKTLLDAGIELESSGEYELAVKVYETALKKDPSSDTAKEASRRIAFCKNRLN